MRKYIHPKNVDTIIAKYKSIRCSVPVPEIKKAGICIDESQKQNKKDKRVYLRLVKKHTEMNKALVKWIEKRAFKEFDIDHIVPKSYGFKNGILPQVIGSIENLKIISNKENLIKGVKLTEDSIALLHKWKLNKR